MMHRLLHLSDPHFGTEQPEVRDALLHLAFELAPELIVVSGDLTQRATRTQFQRARAFIDALPPVPRLLIPGNHDLPLFNLAARLLAPYRRYRQLIARELEPELDTPHWQVSCVNTSRWWRHHRGAISAAQVQRVQARLASAPAQAWRIVVTHHPLAVRWQEDAAELPRGQAQAVSAWVGAGAQALLAGHTHDPHIAPLSAEAPRCWVVLAGTAVSRRVRHGVANSVTVLEQTEPAGGGPLRRRIVRWDFEPRLQAFVPQRSLELGLEARVHAAPAPGSAPAPRGAGAC